MRPGRRKRKMRAQARARDLARDRQRFEARCREILVCIRWPEPAPEGKP